MSEVSPAAVLLATLRAAGATLWVEERPEGLAPMIQGNLTDADRQAIRQHRAALIEILLTELRAEAEKRDDPRAADRRIRFTT